MSQTSIEKRAKKILTDKFYAEEEAQREKIKQEREAEEARKLLTKDNLALLETLDVIPLLEEIRDKYWNCGEIRTIQSDYGSHHDYFELRHNYQSVFQNRISNPSITISLAVYRKTSTLADIKFTFWANDNVFPTPSDKGADYKSYRIETLSCEISRNQFVDYDTVKEWVLDQFGACVLQMTNGDVSARNILEEKLAKHQQMVDRHNRTWSWLRYLKRLVKN